MTLLVIAVAIALPLYIAYQMHRLVRIVKTEVGGDHTTTEGLANLLARKVYEPVALYPEYSLPEHALDPRHTKNAHEIAEKAVAILRRKGLPVRAEWRPNLFRWRFFVEQGLKTT